MDKTELQVEKGNFTRIINPLIEELIKIPFKGCELAVALFIIRKTYGYNKPEDEISLTQFQKGLNRSRQTIVTALKNLQLVNVARLVKQGDSKKCSNLWRINKYYDTWKLVNVARLVKRKRGTSLTETLQLVKTARHTKDNTKDNTKETSSKDDESKALTFGNPLINSFINLLKEFNQSQELDGTRRGNRFAAKRVIEKIRKEFTARVKKEPTDNEIINSMKAILSKADDFHQKNSTNYNYIDKHFYKIIKSSFQRGIVKI